MWLLKRWFYTNDLIMSRNQGMLWNLKKKTKQSFLVNLSTL